MLNPPARALALSVVVLGCADNGGDTADCTPVSAFEDHDGDGVGGAAVELCIADPAQLPAGTASVGGDCNDDLATASTVIIGYADADGDRVTVSTATEHCLPMLPPGFLPTANPEDCNDDDPLVSAPRTFFSDGDGDGYGDPNGSMAFCKASPPSGYALDGSDPDDGDPLITPLDADGDLVADANDCAPADATKWRTATIYQDTDGDTYTQGAGQAACIGAGAPAGYRLVAFGDDCNDMDPALHTPLSAYVDADQDGLGAGTLVAVCAATLPAGYATIAGDVCPTDATATTSPHVTPENAHGARLNEDVPDGTGWSFLGTAPYANLINYQENVRTDWLRLRQYGFALPTTAKVLGIAARVTHQLVTDPDMIPVRDHEIRLYFGLSRTAVNRASAASWTAGAIEDFTYGGPSDLWGRTWTAAEINTISLGIRVTMFDYPDPDDDLVPATPRVEATTLAVTYCAQ
jgi:hypothetical protein